MNSGASSDEGSTGALSSSGSFNASGDEKTQTRCHYDVRLHLGEHFEEE